MVVEGVPPPLMCVLQGRGSGGTDQLSGAHRKSSLLRVRILEYINRMLRLGCEQAEQLTLKYIAQEYAILPPLKK